MKSCYVFDLDGTLADLTHRLHFIQSQPKNWDAFFAACVDDKPIDHVIHLLVSLQWNQWDIVIVSGRSDAVRRETEAWLFKYGLGRNPLYMRKAGDHRPDYVVKAELLAQLRADGYEPIMAFDDREQVVKMWRDNGIPCAQVAEGRF